MNKNLAVISILLLFVASTIFLINRPIPRSGSIKVDDIKIAYKIFGKGRPLIMITGYSGTMDMWSPQFIKIVASKYKVIVFDNRGMGKTTASSKKFTIELFAKDTAGLIDALKIKKAHVLGWSLGTYIAQELALNYPGKVDKLILYAADTGGKQAIDPDKKVMDTLSYPSKDGKELIKLLIPPRWLKANPDITKYFPRATETSIPENVERQFIAWRNWKGTYSRLPRLITQTLLITGTEDILTPPQNSDIMAKLMLHAELARIPGGGHGVMFQYPQKMADKIMTFLEK